MDGRPSHPFERVWRWLVLIGWLLAAAVAAGLFVGIIVLAAR